LPVEPPELVLPPVLPVVPPGLPVEPPVDVPVEPPVLLVEPVVLLVVPPVLLVEPVVLLVEPPPGPVEPPLGLPPEALVSVPPLEPPFGVLLLPEPQAAMRNAIEALVIHVCGLFIARPRLKRAHGRGPRPCTLFRLFCPSSCPMGVGRFSSTISRARYRLGGELILNNRSKK
jgi:hypothetical protein